MVESAHKLIELDTTHFRYQMCRDTLQRLQERASWQLSEQVVHIGAFSDVFRLPEALIWRSHSQEREAAEALEVQRVLEEQRRLEEEVWCALTELA